MRLGHLTRNFKDYLGEQTGKIKKTDSGVFQGDGS